MGACYTLRRLFVIGLYVPSVLGMTSNAVTFILKIDRCLVIGKYQAGTKTKQGDYG